jgi:sugar phosphate isomerase/epimerase
MLLSIFADELGVDITKAVPTIKSWGLDTVDLRGRIYGKSFESLDAQQLVDLKKLLDDNGMKVACLQSSLAKSHQPDAEVRKAEAEKLEGIIRAADALECRRVRSFYFWQRYEGRQGALAAQPDQLQKTMDMFAPLADRAKEAGLTLAFENCGTTPDEVLAMLDLMDVPEWGLAWDPHNNWGSEEWKSGGDAYVQRMISHSTMLHIKARYAVEGLSEDLIPYDRILELFLNRGLDGPVSVETHNPDKQVTNEEMSKRTVLALQRAWPTAAQGGVVARKSGHGLKRPWHDDPVGFAVVGLGMGFNRARQLTETSGTRLIGVCDLDAERAQKAGGTLDVPHTLEMDRWLDDDNVEVIMVMTETGNHGKVAERALNAGKHVISTKPMDANVANCDRMIALAEEKGLTLGVDLEMRHTPGFCALFSGLRNTSRTTMPGAGPERSTVAVSFRTSRFTISIRWRLRPVFRLGCDAAYSISVIRISRRKIWVPPCGNMLTVMSSPTTQRRAFRRRRGTTSMNCTAKMARSSRRRAAHSIRQRQSGITTVRGERMHRSMVSQNGSTRWIILPPTSAKGFR